LRKRWDAPIFDATADSDRAELNLALVAPAGSALPLYQLLLIGVSLRIAKADGRCESDVHVYALAVSAADFEVDGSDLQGGTP